MSDLNSVIQEIETQRQKPLEVQLEDFKIAGAKLLQTIDNLVPLIDKVVTTLEEETNNNS